MSLSPQDEVMPLLEGGGPGEGNPGWLRRQPILICDLRCPQRPVSGIRVTLRQLCHDSQTQQLKHDTIVPYTTYQNMLTQYLV